MIILFIVLALLGLAVWWVIRSAMQDIDNDY
ncbi:MAG: hypothetical protein ACFWUG_05380 [Rahnella inusitata]|jgi:hypothetical protein